MDYEITTPEGKSWVQIDINAPVTVDLQNRILKEARLNADLSKRADFIVDVTQVQNVTQSFDQYSLAYEVMLEYRLDQPMRIAVVTNPFDHSHNFAETVFRNAGYDFRLFQDMQSAIAWMEDTEDSA